MLLKNDEQKVKAFQEDLKALTTTSNTVLDGNYRLNAELTLIKEDYHLA